MKEKHDRNEKAGGVNDELKTQKDNRTDRRTAGGINDQTLCGQVKPL